MALENNPIIIGGGAIIGIFIFCGIIGSCVNENTKTTSSVSAESYSCRRCYATSSRPFHGDGNGMDGYCMDCVQKIIIIEATKQRVNAITGN